MSSFIYRSNLEDQYILYSKGADNVMRDRLSQSSTKDLEFIDQENDKFSKLGLRTLYITKKLITKTEYEEWSKAKSEAENNNKDSN